MGIIGVVIRVKSGMSVCKNALSTGLRKVRSYCASIADRWHRDCVHAAEIERLNKLEKTRVFEREPWIGWL